VRRSSRLHLGMCSSRKEHHLQLRRCPAADEGGMVLRRSSLDRIWLWPPLLLAALCLKCHLQQVHSPPNDPGGMIDD